MNEPSNFIRGSQQGCPDNELENPPYVPGEPACLSGVVAWTREGPFVVRTMQSPGFHPAAGRAASRTEGRNPAEATDLTSSQCLRGRAWAQMGRHWGCSKSRRIWRL